jgi:hypothetical protein
MTIKCNIDLVINKTNNITLPVCATMEDDQRLGCHTLSVYNLLVYNYKPASKEMLDWIISHNLSNELWLSKGSNNYAGPGPKYVNVPKGCLSVINGYRKWPTRLHNSLKSQVYEEIAEKFPDSHLFYFMSDNLNWDTYMWNTRGVVKQLIKNGWGCWSTGVGSNPNHRASLQPSMCQGWILTPPRQMPFVAKDTAFVKDDKCLTTQALKKYFDSQIYIDYWGWESAAKNIKLHDVEATWLGIDAFLEGIK